MERGRTEFMREKGVSFSKLHDEGYLFVVVEANIKYKAPAYYDDLLEVKTVIENSSPVTITFGTTIANGKKNLLVTGSVKVACIHGSNRKVCHIPDGVMKRL
jgi:acyl-CoA thioester hydrolase